jgi:methionine-gamma-lyase
MVMHSVTKYINGHGDVLAGALLGRRDDMARLKDPGIRYITGALLSPMAAMLVLRGLKTLSLRMQKHSCNALAVARLLETHPAVAWVSYPFLESHPNHDLAKRQMSAGSGMLAFGLHTGFEGARRFMDRLEIFARAVSLGDTESLIMHPASLVKARQKRRPAAKLEAGIGDDLMRMSVGIEDTSDLLADIRQALEGF